MKQPIKQFISLLILIAFVVLVEHYLGWQQLLQPWSELAIPSLISAIALTFLSYWLRAMRQFDYFRHEMSGRFLLSFKLMLQHNLLNNLLPMRSGEISFPVLMQRYFDIPMIRSVPALMWFRILDLHTLAALSLLALGHYWLPLGVTITFTLLWLTLPWAFYHSHNWLQQCLDPHHENRWQRVLHKALDSLPQSRHDFWRAWAWTAINWLVKLAVFAWLLISFAEMPKAAAWIGAIAGDLTSVLPIHGVAGAGTYEAGVVAGTALFNINVDQALSAAINLHLFILGSTLLGGAIALLLPGRSDHE